jgi:hypothetical protein
VRTGIRLLARAGGILLSSVFAHATSNHEYYPDEFDTIVNGISPNGKYAITSHGSSDNYGYTGFHIYLTNNVTGKKIGPLEEISDNLDTGSDAFAAKWSADSKRVYIVYRISRQDPLQVVFYRIDHYQAFPLKESHVDGNGEQISYWQKYGSGTTKSVKIFGRPNLNQYLKTQPVPGMY